MALGLTTAKRVFFIVALVSIVASLVLIGEFYRTGAFTTYNPVASQITNSVGMYLYFGDFIANQVGTLGKGQTTCLKTGNLRTGRGSTAYRQSIAFAKPGQFNGPRLVFKEVKTPTETASTALTVATGTSILDYTIFFDSMAISRIDQNGVLTDLNEKKLNLLNTNFVFATNQNRYNAGQDTIELTLLGGFGTNRLTGPCNGNPGTLRVNGEVMDETVVRIICAPAGTNELGIVSISIRPGADPVSPTADALDVLPRHGITEYMREPQSIFAPYTDLFFVGTGTQVKQPTGGYTPPSGGGFITLDGTRSQYRISFTTKTGRYKNMDIVRRNPFAWGSRSGNREFVFNEATWINVQDYFAITSGTGLNDKSWVQSLNKINTQENKVFWRDVSSGQTKQAYYDPVTLQGTMNLGGYDFLFQVNAGGTAIQADLNGNGAIGGGNAQIVLSNSMRLRFGGVGNIDIIVPWQIRQEQNVDLVDTVQISQAGNRLASTVTAPAMQDDISVEGREQGMDQFGNRFVWDGDRTPETVNVYSPGSGQASPQVGISSYSGGQSKGILLFTCEKDKLAAAQKAQQS